MRALRPILLFVLLGLPVVIYLFLRIFGENRYAEIPVFHEAGSKSPRTECNWSKETHRVPEFELSTSSGELFSQKHLETKISIVSFVMEDSTHLHAHLYNELIRIKDALSTHQLQLLLISQTGAQLTTNRNRLETIPWILTSGDSALVTELARCGFILPFEDRDNQESLAFNTLVLVDQERRIRGYYPVADMEEVDRLILEIKVLLYEQELG